jgi:hypothetical protein
VDVFIEIIEEERAKEMARHEQLTLFT